MLSTIAVILIILLAIILGWHWLFAGAVVITSMAWGFAITSVVLLCVGVLLVFILAGTGIFVVALVALLWTVLSIVFFPILFPLLIPLFIIFLFVSYSRAKQKRKAAQQQPNSLEVK
jgi:hypothetical protein